MLAIDGLDLRSALDQASDLVGAALGADKIDIFLYEQANHTLVAYGVSHTELSRRQRELGLNRLPVANGGRAAQVFTTQMPFLSGHLDQDPEELLGIKGALAVKSSICVPLYVAGELRGVLQADSQQPEVFSEYDLHFVQAVAGWIGTITHRAELIEAIRREAQQEARRSTAEELVTIIAHDLGNYLTPLMGRASLLRRRAVREGHADNLEDAREIEAALTRLDRLVRDLLDTGRLEQDIFTLNRQQVDIGTLARSTAEMLSRPSCGILVTAAEEVTAEVDPERLRQALENLLSNAINHSPEGATVYVDIATMEQDGARWATIEVRDQGPGISPDLLPQLFTRFSRGPASKGLGLGLYLAQGIARAHNGTLTAASAPGEGATFRLAIPIVASEPANLAAAPSA